MAEVINGGGSGSSSGSSGSSGLTPTDVKTSAYTASAGELVLVNPSGASADIAITLPATAANCAVMLVTSAAGRWNVTINRNGNTVNGLTDTTRFSMQFEGQLAHFRPGSSGYQGQVNNPPTVINGYLFNGAGTYEIAHSATLNPGSAFSFDFWIYIPQGGISSNQYVFNNSDNSSVGTAIAFGATNAFIVRDNSVWRNGPLLQSAVWHHVVIAYGSSNITTYVNGIQATSGTASASITAYTSPKFFGGLDASTQRASGIGIWNFRQWSSKLTATDAVALFGGGIPTIINPLGSSPVLWLRGQEPRTSLVDISGNGLNGTLSGTVLSLAAPRQLNI